MPRASLLERALEHHRHGRTADAESLYRRLLEKNPADPDALHGLGLIALDRGDVGTALDLIEEALERRPRSAVFLSNLAATYHRAHLVERARECAERAMVIDPRFAAGYTNHGHALCTLGDAAAAEASYLKALSLEASPLNRLNVGLMRLLDGDYAAGWPLYEARLEIVQRSGDTARVLARLAKVPRWRGERLEGRKLLLWTEQGLGDTVMMLRYLPLLREHGAAHVGVLCEASLVRLIEALDVADEVFCDVDAADWPRRYDVQIPTLSLPLAFGTTLETIPRPPRYLAVPEALARTWTEKTAKLAPPRIGLVWAGGRDTAADPYRSIALKDFEPVLAQRGYTFVSLQKGPEAAQRANVRREIVDLMQECSDLLDTAALIDRLDVVISVDTVVAHLAAALGKPTWLLNRRSSEWRWLKSGSASPWYPTLRIFRQGERTWRAVLEEVARALQAQVPARTVWTRLFGDR